jgi:hypothetical protein
MATQTITKLKKLIAHEQSARAIGSVAEAEAFAERIHEWLIRHKLSMQEVELASKEDQEVDGTELGGTKREVWLECLAGNIAESYFCQAIARTYRKGGFSIIIIGRKADREIVVELLAYFEQLARELAEAGATEYREVLRLAHVRGATLGAATKRFRYSFLTGFSLSLCARFRESKEKSEQSMALVRCDGKVKEFMSNFELGEAKMPYFPRLGAAGFIAGSESGSRVALTAHTLKTGDAKIPR